MRKFYLTAVFILMAIFFVSCNKMPDKFDKDTFLSKLSDQGFLPKEVTENLPDYERKETSDGTPVDHWSETNDEGELIQKIEVDVPDDVMTKYQYTANEIKFDFPDEPLTIDEGKTLAMKFVKEFRSDLADLDWDEGEWNQSLYEPGNIEAWTVSDKEHSYGVMVDLNAGTVVYFSEESA